MSLVKRNLVQSPQHREEAAEAQERASQDLDLELRSSVFKLWSLGDLGVQLRIGATTRIP